MTEQTNKEQKQSPGQILVSARQALNIDLAELAEQIKVPLHVLEAIEKDRVPKNLPETFVRGYIRSYAKKVNVAEELVLPQLETIGVVYDEPDKDMQSFSRRNKRKALEKRLSRISWVLGAILVVALIIWWMQDNQYSDFAPVAGSDDHIIVDAQEVKSELTASSIITNSNDDESNLNQTIPPDDLAKVAEENKQPAMQRPVKLTASQKAVVADNGEVDEEGFIKVEMKFENECWVEVHDVGGDRIAIGNKPAGYLMSLNAQSPLNVLLGNPDGVSIWVNGKPFSIADLPKNRVARFEIEAL